MSEREPAVPVRPGNKQLTAGGVGAALQIFFQPSFPSIQEVPLMDFKSEGFW